MREIPKDKRGTKLAPRQFVVYATNGVSPRLRFGIVVKVGVRREKWSGMGYKSVTVETLTSDEGRVTRSFLEWYDRFLVVPTGALPRIELAALKAAYAKDQEKNK